MHASGRRWVFPLAAVLLAGVALLSLGALVAHEARASAYITDGTVSLGVNDLGILGAPTPQDVGSGLSGSENCQNYLAGKYPTWTWMASNPTNDEAMDCDREGNGLAICYDGLHPAFAHDERVSSAPYEQVISNGFVPKGFSASDSRAVGLTRVADLEIGHDTTNVGGLPGVFRTHVTLANAGSAPMDHVQYDREMSFGSSGDSAVHGDSRTWDSDITFNTLDTLPSGTPAPSAVVHSLATGGYGLGNPCAKSLWAAAGSFPPGEGPPAGPPIQKVAGDGGATWGLDFGTLPPGRSKAFDVFWGGVPDEASARADLAAVGAQIYLLSQPMTESSSSYCTGQADPNNPLCTHSYTPAPGPVHWFMALGNATVWAPPALSASIEASGPDSCLDNTLHFRAVATEPWGKAVGFSWQLDDGFSSLAPSFDHAFAVPGAHAAQLQVTDDYGSTATAAVEVQAPDGSCPPVLAFVPDQRVLAGTFAQACASASAQDGTTLAWSVAGLPPGARWIGHCVLWQTRLADVGDHGLEVTVSDGHHKAAASFTITVYTLPALQQASCADSDGDGVCDAGDNCPGIANRGQEDLPRLGIGDACDPACMQPASAPGILCRPAGNGRVRGRPGGGAADRDGDGVADVADDCPDVADRNQSDLDGDGVGDACDADIDGDGVPNASPRAGAALDNCPTVPNPDQADRDGDGLGDACRNAQHLRPSARPTVATQANAARPSGGPFSAPLLLALFAGAALVVALRRRWAGLVAVFSRLTRKGVDGHPLRQAILNAVEAEPGIHFAGLLRATGKRQGVLRHHLDVLVRAGQVQVETVGGYQCCFPGPPAAGDRILAVLKTEVARRLLDAVRGLPGLPLAEAARRAGTQYRTAKHHLARLESVHAVRLEEGPDGLRVFPL